jgi:hypothetical protein
MFTDRVSGSGPVSAAWSSGGRPRRRAHVAAAAVAPRTDERGQASDRAHHPRALSVVLDADEPADGRGARGGVGARERHDLLGRDARHLLRALGRPGRELRRETLEPLGVRRDVLGVVKALGDDHVHEPERERRVGTRERAHVPVGRRGRPRAQRVDDDHAGARLARLLHDRPLVQVGDDRVRPPQHDEAAVGEVLVAQADGRAGGLHLGREHRLPADRALEAARAQAREEAARERVLLHHALGAREAVRQHRLAAVLGDGRREPIGDVRQRVVPRHALEGALALRARADERMEQPIGAVGALEEVADLGAQGAAGERMLLDPDELLGHSVAHGDLPGARVRAVVRTRATDDSGFGGHAVHRGSHTGRPVVQPYRRTNTR